MKKMLFAAVALVLAAGFTACSKEEAAPENIVKVEFAVADKAGFDTDSRAVKTAWAEGDQIMVLFKPTGGSWLIAEESIEELLILKYTGSAWVVSNMPANAASLGSAGKYAAIHYRVPAEMSCGIAGSYLGSFYYFTNYAGGEVLYYMGDEAQYTLADGKLNLGTISLAMSEVAIQFSVKNLASVEGEWSLASVDHTWTGSEYIGDGDSPTNGFQAQTPAFNPSGTYLTTFSEEWATPVVNGADRSFFFTTDNEWDSATALTFLLQNKATWKTYKYEYKPEPFAMPAVAKAYLLPAFDSGKWVEIE